MGDSDDLEATSERQWGAIAGVELRKVLWRGARWRVFDGARGLLRVAVTVGEVLSDDEVRTFHRVVANRARVVHSGLARILACGVEDGLFYQVSALPDGPRLSQRVRSGAMLEPEIRDLIRQLAGAVHAAHRLGVVVGQLTPDTLLLTSSGAKICDVFPLLRRRDSGPYDPPEASDVTIEGLDERADVFALGAVAWFAITGRPPTRFDRGEQLRLNPDTYGISRGMVWLVERLLEYDQRNRFQSMVAVLDALDQIEIAGHREPEIRHILSARVSSEADPFDIALVGREQTLAGLDRFRVAAREGAGSTVVLSGPPGGGRSRLLQEMCVRARKAGDTVLVARCAPNDPTPLAPIRFLVDRYLEVAEHRDGFLEKLVTATEGIGDLLRGLSDALDRLLPVPEKPEFRDHTSFYSAVSQFLLRIGEFATQVSPANLIPGVVQGGAASLTRCGPLVLVIDDAQWLDDASVQVLRRVALVVTSRPVLLLLSVREDSAQRGPTFAAKLAPAQVQTLSLGPLSATEVGALCRAMIWYPLAPRIIALIIARTGGHPLSVVAFVQTIIDEGVLLPNWGEWDVDMARFAELALPGSAQALVQRRLSALDPDAHHVLATAVCLGSRIEISTLASLCGSERVQKALLTCRRARLLIRRGRVAMVTHQEVANIVLASTPLGEQARIHRAIALHLRETAPTDVYRIAGHARQCIDFAAPQLVCDLLVPAGREAATSAPESARVFLQAAACAAARAGGHLSWEDTCLLGRVCTICGALEAASEAFRAALGLSSEPEKVAQVHLAAAGVHALGFRTDAVCAEIDRGLAVLDLQPLRGRLRQRARALFKRTFRGRREAAPASADAVARKKMHLQFLELGGRMAYLRREFRLAMALAARAHHVAKDLHPCAEQARATMAYAIRQAAMGRPTGFVSESDRALAIADRVGGTSLATKLLTARAMGAEILGDFAASEHDLRTALERGGIRLSAEHFASTALTLARSLDRRGYPLEACAWVQKACSNLQVAARESLPHFQSSVAYASCLDATCGRHEQARDALEMAKNALKPVSTGGAAKVFLQVCSLRVLYESRVFDDTFDLVAQTFLEAMPAADPLAPFGHDGFVTLTLGELERVMLRYRNGTDVRLSADRELTGLRTAMGRLQPMRGDPLISLHLEWIEATVRWLQGEVGAAHRGWSDATKRAHRLDAPRVLASISRFRAHALIEEGAREAGLREAKVAAEIARKQGMVTLDSWIRGDFNLVERSQHPDSADTLVSVGTGTEAPNSHRIRQHFDTLLQIRMSALRESSAQGQAKAILSELMLVLGASRGWMLAYTGNTPEIELVHGCTADGSELLELDAASRDVVEQTRASGELTIGSAPQSDEFDGTSSHLWSATTRSIMGAPIRLGERLVGVVCLDNRMSGSTFSRADEQMLQAMAGHIALAGEVLTARLHARSQSIQHGLAQVLEQASKTLAIGVVGLAPNGSFVHVSPAVVSLATAWGEPALWWRLILGSEQVDPAWVGLGDGAMHIARVVTGAPDGSRRIFEITFTGQVRHLVGFGPSQVVLVADTTARSMTEINLRDRCDELAAARDQAAADLRGRLALREQFGALLSMVSEEIEDEVEDPDPSDALASTVGLLEVVRRVARVARIESGEQILETLPIALTELVNQVHRDVGSTLAGSNGQLMVDLRARETIVSDFGLLRQVLGELVTYVAGKGPRAEVLLEVWIDRRHESVCVFEISRAQPMEPGERTRSEAEQLALTVTQHAAYLLQGTLQLHRSERQRRVLTLTLPVGESVGQRIDVAG